MKDGKLHCPKTIDSAHTRHYHGRKMGQAVTIELSTTVFSIFFIIDKLHTHYMRLEPVTESPVWATTHQLYLSLTINTPPQKNKKWKTQIPNVRVEAYILYLTSPTQ